MIRVALAPEPANFDADVRRPGLDAIRELVGEAPLETRRGPKRKRIAESREAISAERYPPLWRDTLDDMLVAYKRMCAYTCLYIEHVTGGASVDHVLPKSTRWDRVYEWTNYRLACSLMNSRKGALTLVLDPCEIDDGWFCLELDAYQVIPNPELSGGLAQKIADTIDLLELNDNECLKARGEYVRGYLDGEIGFSYLERRAAFIARELRRQGRLHDADRATAGEAAQPGGELL